MATKLSEKEAAQAYRNLETLLPEILRRGAVAALEGAGNVSSSGLSWANLPKAELMEINSELASFEKIRRAMAALEEHNLRSGLDGCYAPTSGLLSSLAGVDVGVAENWLNWPSVRGELKGYMRRLRLENANDQQIADFNRLQSSGIPKADPIELIAW